MANANNGNHNILLCFCIYNFNLQCNKQRERNNTHEQTTKLKRCERLVDVTEWIYYTYMIILS